MGLGCKETKHLLTGLFCYGTALNPVAAFSFYERSRSLCCKYQPFSVSLLLYDFCKRVKTLGCRHCKLTLVKGVKVFYCSWK